MNEERLSEAGQQALMSSPTSCPACLSWQTFEYSGGQFIGCNLCDTISAKDRRTTAVYDEAYVSLRYDRYPTTRPMSLLRYQVMMDVLNLHDALEAGEKTVQPGKLLDVGYGNGDFIRVCREHGWDAFGNDVNPTFYPGVVRVPLPSEPKWPNRYKVVTFFDALEHFEDLKSVRWVSHHTDWIIASFPNPAPEFPFKLDWKHYRPGEHHLYFQPTSLEKIFSFDERVAKLVYYGGPEDAIRGKGVGGGRNITTVALRCYDA